MGRVRFVPSHTDVAPFVLSSGFSPAIFAARHSRPPPAPTHGYQPWQAPGWWSLGVPASQLAQANPRYSDSTRVHARVGRTPTTPIPL
jgi:hypothetical protein